MLDIVKQFIIKQNININSKVICAVSGGADSVCLIHILHDLGYDVVLAHVNHHKREQSELEEVKMKELADNLNVPFELLSYHYDGVDNFHNDSHNARYNFFTSLCKKYNTNIIATAHHSDDQIETVLMKILEGSNLYGYGGIPSIKDDGVYLTIRPLLCVNKNEIYSYVNKKGYEYFEDSSNHEDVFLRNRIRHHITPLLKQECSDLNNKILEYSIQLHEAFSFIRNLSIKYLIEHNNKIEYDSFNLLDIALKKDIISLLLEKYNIRKNNNIIIQILNMLNSNKGNKSIKLENNYMFIRSYNLSYIEKIKDNNIDNIIINLNDDIIYNDMYHFYFSKIKPNNAKYIKLCYNELKLPFKIRSRVDGDIIKTLVGSKKVSRVFIDNKIPSNKRNDIPVILDDNDNILWIFDLVKSKSVYEQKELGDIYFIGEQLWK